MRNEFTAYVIQDGDWYVAFCVEVPEGNGQGRTKEDALTNLGESIALLFEDRRADSTDMATPPGERRTLVVVG